MSAARAYASAVEEHRKQLMRVAEKGSVDRVKALYDQARSEMASKVRRAVPARKDPFSVRAKQLVMAQVEDGIFALIDLMTGALGDASREAQVESLRGTADWIGRVEKAATGFDITLPIDEASRFWGVINGRRESLLRAHRASMAAYGADTVKAIEDQLALSLLQGESTDEAVGRVIDADDGAMAGEWWRAERIVRTETAFAYNQTAADGIAEVAREEDDFRIRWTEHVSNAGVPLDDRVAADSLAMHGQVSRPGEGWIMPPNARGVGESMRGQWFFAAPSRPNGRETLSPWRPTWGIPGWEWRGRKAWLVRP